jgi:hypothetical protein
MDGWAYAVVDNSQKPGTGNRERGAGNLGTPVTGGKAGTGNGEQGTGGGGQGTGNMGTPVAVNQGGKRSCECGLRSAERGVRNAECGMATANGLRRGDRRARGEILVDSQDPTPAACRRACRATSPWRLRPRGAAREKEPALVGEWDNTDTVTVRRTQTQTEIIVAPRNQPSERCFSCLVVVILIPYSKCLANSRAVNFTPFQWRGGKREYCRAGRKRMR